MAAVTDLDAAIRARLAARRVIRSGQDGDGAARANAWIIRAQNALVAVLDRHKPGYPDGVEYEWEQEPTCFADGTEASGERRKGTQTPGYWCEACHVFSPCPTVLDVARELGIGVDGG
jgi:hypothetical protein